MSLFSSLPTEVSCRIIALLPISGLASLLYTCKEIRNYTKRVLCMMETLEEGDINRLPSEARVAILRECSSLRTVQFAVGSCEGKISPSLLFLLLGRNRATLEHVVLYDEFYTEYSAALFSILKNCPLLKTLYSEVRHDEMLIQDFLNSKPSLKEVSLPNNPSLQKILSETEFFWLNRPSYYALYHCNNLPKIQRQVWVWSKSSSEPSCVSSPTHTPACSPSIALKQTNPATCKNRSPLAQSSGPRCLNLGLGVVDFISKGDESRTFLLSSSHALDSFETPKALISVK